MKHLSASAASFVLVVSLAVTVAGPASERAAPQESPQAAFRSGASAVMVDVTVRDKSRRAITGLSAKDFQVFDNGMPQQVDDLSYGKLPIDVTVALDVSYSVTGELLDRLRQAVKDLMGDLGAKDRLKLVLFNMRVTRTIDYTTDVKAVEKAIRGATAGGGTALLDALSVTLVSASSPDRRQLAVFFTDGRDTSSTTSPEVLKEVAERTRATLTFVVPLAQPMTTIAMPSAPPSSPGQPTARTTISMAGGSTARGPLQPVFPTLARETGGRILPVGPSVSLSVVFRSVLSEFRSAYVLYYTARGVDRAGYHAIDVKVKRDGAVVQARRGYFSS